MNPRIVKSSFLAIIAVPALVLAADAPVSPAKGGSALSEQDVEVLAKLHHDNEMEVEMGKTAVQNGGAKQVKAFGALLVKDHTLADKQLQSYAKRRGIDLTPPAPKDQVEAAEAQAAMDGMRRLEALKGDVYDREFAKLMVEDHEKAVTMVETTLRETSNAKVQSLLNKVLPVLKDHLKLAQQLDRQLNDT
ncbi:MAG: DUF4142 domain-containing protein [Myxococcaceae bacterium]|nr:DUF4142 domain-containing protein [Myxococcaceae bacterium]